MDRKKVVFISSAYRGDIEKNVEMARRYCRMAADRGVVPIAPHLFLPSFIDEETERDMAIGMDRDILDRCDELWCCGSRMTDGMAAEFDRAVETGKKVRFFTEEELCTE